MRLSVARVRLGAEESTEVQFDANFMEGYRRAAVLVRRGVAIDLENGKTFRTSPSSAVLVTAKVLSVGEGVKSEVA